MTPLGLTDVYGLRDGALIRVWGTKPGERPLPRTFHFEYWGRSSPRYLIYHYAGVPWDADAYFRLPGVTCKIEGQGRQGPVTTHVSRPGLVIAWNRGMFDRGGLDFLELQVSWWLVVAITAWLPARWPFYRGRRLRAARRHEGGLCEQCGYDLRGLASDRCPECGHLVAAPSEGVGNSDRGNLTI
ncbi:MAG TPA: hypothetical protein VH475_01905 [Tepidisphaeraceae bacterium]|jgi:hypothetical protein